MPQTPENWDTSNNRDADPYAGGTQLPVNQGQYQPAPTNEQDDRDWLLLARRCKSASDQYLGPLRSTWSDAYRAYRNQHATGSRYNDTRWRGRSKHHRPITRTQVHKADANFANSLFSTSDVITAAPMDPSNPKHVASAAFSKALLDYRLDRSSGKAGIPFFPVAVGAHQTARITGLVISKQYWDRYEVDTGEFVEAPVQNDETGEPVLDQLTGEPVTMMSPKRRVIRDRPEIQLFPPDLVLRDPGADWRDQAQSSAYIGLMHPLMVGDIEGMMEDPQVKTTYRKWRKMDRVDILRGRIGGIESTGVANAREGNTGARTEINGAGEEFDRVWCIEWFMRRKGKEWHFWTISDHVLLSDPTPLEVAYPHLGGERPIVIGYGTIEPFKIDPLSNVSALMPMQQEINDLANLTIDGVKETIRPMTYVRRGRNIDIAQIQNRSGDGVVYVDNIKEDLGFDRPGAIGGEAFLQMDRLSADYDDAAGQVNNATVASSRNLGDTVGGLKMANAQANTVADFDVRTLVETWTEPVLRQVVKLEQYYEDDQIILQVAGAKAKLFSQFGLTEIDDDLIVCEVAVSVSVGIGSATPDVKLQKIGTALALTQQAVGPEVVKKAKQDAIINEIWGQAGYQDAAERFFHMGDNTDARISERDAHIDALTQQLESKEQQYATQLEDTRLGIAGDLIGKVVDIHAQEQAHEHAMEQGILQGGIAMGADKRGQAHDLKKTEITGAQREKQMQISAKAKANGAKKPNGAQPPEDEEEAMPKATAGLDQLLAGILPRIMPKGGNGMPPEGPGAEAVQQQAAAGGQGQQPGGGDAMMQMMAQLIKSQQQMGQALQMLAQAVMTPNMVQRDPQTGQIIGTTKARMPMGGSPAPGAGTPQPPGNNAQAATPAMPRGLPPTMQ